MAGNSLSIVRNTCQKRHSFPGYISHDASVPFLFLTAEPQASNENNKAINQLFFPSETVILCNSPPNCGNSLFGGNLSYQHVCICVRLKK